MVLARFATNRRLGDAMHQQAYFVLTSPPRAPAPYYDAMQPRSISHNATLHGRWPTAFRRDPHTGCVTAATRYHEAIAWNSQTVVDTRASMTLAA